MISKRLLALFCVAMWILGCVSLPTTPIWTESTRQQQSDSDRWQKDDSDRWQKKDEVDGARKLLTNRAGQRSLFFGKINKKLKISLGDFNKVSKEVSKIKKKTAGGGSVKKLVQDSSKDRQKVDSEKKKNKRKKKGNNSNSKKNNSDPETVISGTNGHAVKLCGKRCLFKLDDIYKRLNMRKATSIPTQIGTLKLEEGEDGIELHDEILTGTIPTEIGELIGLKFLSIRNSRLVKEIPIAVGNLTNLVHLDISNNTGLDSFIPPHLGFLHQLTHLALSGNGLFLNIPTELGNLTNLQQLDLSDNLLESNLPTELGQLTLLSMMDVSGNALTGSIPSLGDLVALQKLYLSDNEFQSFVPQELFQHPNLTILDCGGNEELVGNLSEVVIKSSPRVYAEIYFDGNEKLEGNLPPVQVSEQLNISGTKMTNEYGVIPFQLPALFDVWQGLHDFFNLPRTATIPTAIGHFKTLLSNLTMSNVTGTIPSEIGLLVNLTSLKIGNSTLVGTIPGSLGNLVQLESLDLRNNTLNGSVPDSFSQLSKLTNLQLSGNALTGFDLPGSAPRKVKVTKIWDNRLEISFESPISTIMNSSKFHINVRTTNTNDVMDLIHEFSNFDIHAFSIPELRNNTIYEVRVRALRGGEESFSRVLANQIEGGWSEAIVVRTFETCETGKESVPQNGGQDPLAPQVCRICQDKFFRIDPLVQNRCIQCPDEVNGSVLIPPSCLRSVLRGCSLGQEFAVVPDGIFCRVCRRGYYRDDPNSQQCRQCPESFPETLANGTAREEDCLPSKGWFAKGQGKTRTRESCNDQKDPLFHEKVDCDQIGLTVETLPLKNGYWRIANTSLDIRECHPQQYCQPRESGQLCSPFHTGVLCSSCVNESYVMKDEQCVWCSEEMQSTDLKVVMGWGFLATVLILAPSFCLVYKAVSSAEQQSRSLPSIIRRCLPSRQLRHEAMAGFRILLGFFQVVLQFSITTKFLGRGSSSWMSFFTEMNLGIVFRALDVGCVLRWNYYRLLLSYTIIPLIVVFLMGLVVGFTRWCKYRNYFRVRGLFVYLVLQICFLIYPGVSSTILRTFLYDALPAFAGEEDPYVALQVDPTIDFNDSMSVRFRRYAFCMIVIYPVGIMLLFIGCAAFYQLKKDSEEEVETHLLSSLSILTRPYNHRFWYEGYELFRKFCLTSVFILIDQASVSWGRMSFLFMGFVFLWTLQYMKPYKRWYHHVLAIFSLMLIVIVGFIGVLETMGNISHNVASALVSWILITETILFFVGLVFVVKQHNDQNASVRHQKRTEKVEQASSLLREQDETPETVLVEEEDRELQSIRKYIAAQSASDMDEIKLSDDEILKLL